jgi:lipopolysaccharide export system permease protein
MTLDRYLAMRFLRLFLAILAAFAVLTAVVETVEQFRRFAGDTVGYAEAVELALLRLPANLHDILPLIVMLATIALFIGLARSSELTAARAGGRSALRAAVAPAVMAALIGGAAIGLVNPLIAVTSQRYDVLETRYSGGLASVLSVSEQGLWLRQRSPEGQTVIRAGRVSLDGGRLFDVSFFGFDGTGRAIYRIEADAATLGDGAWQIGPGKRWELVAGANPEADARVFDRMTLASDLTRDEIRDGSGAPGSVPIWEMPGFIARLEAAGFAATAHRLFLQMELAKPLFLAAMVLAGAAFLLRPARFGRTGAMVLAAVLTGAGLFFLRNFARVMGEAGDIPVAAAAWAPPTAALLIGVWLMLTFEDA